MGNFPNNNAKKGKKAMLRKQTLKNLSINDMQEIQELKEIPKWSPILHRLHFYSFTKRLFGLNKSDMRSIYAGSIF